MTPKQAEQWFDRLPADVKPGVEEMYQAFAARYRNSAQGVRDAEAAADQWRAAHPNVSAVYSGSRGGGKDGLTMRRMTGMWRFGLPPAMARGHTLPFETFWTAVDEWIDQNTQAPPDKSWRPTY